MAQKWINLEDRYKILSQQRDEFIKYAINQFFPEPRTEEEKRNIEKINLIVGYGVSDLGMTISGVEKAFSGVSFYEMAYNPSVLKAQVKSGVMQADSLEYKIKYAMYKCAIETKSVMEKDLANSILLGDVRDGESVEDAKLRETMSSYLSKLESPFFEVLEDIKENGISDKYLNTITDRLIRDDNGETFNKLNNAVYKVRIESLSAVPSVKMLAASINRLISHSLESEEQLLVTLEHLATDESFYRYAFRNCTSTEEYIQQYGLRKSANALYDASKRKMDKNGTILIAQLKDIFKDVETVSKQAQRCKDPDNAKDTIIDWKIKTAVNFRFSQEGKNDFVTLTSKDVYERLENGPKLKETEFLFYAISRAWEIKSNDELLTELKEIATKQGLSNNALNAVQKITSLSEKEQKLVNDKKALADLIDNHVFPYLDVVTFSNERSNFVSSLVGYLGQASTLDAQAEKEIQKDVDKDQNPKEKIKEEVEKTEEKKESILLNPDGTQISSENKAILDNCVNYARELNAMVGTKFTKEEIEFHINTLRVAYQDYEYSCNDQEKWLKNTYETTKDINSKYKDADGKIIPYEQLTEADKQEIAIREREELLEYAKNVYESVRDMVGELESRIEQEKNVKEVEKTEEKKESILLNPDGTQISPENKAILDNCVNYARELNAMIGTKYTKEEIEFHINTLRVAYQDYEYSCNDQEKWLKNTYETTKDINSKYKDADGKIIPYEQLTEADKQEIAVREREELLEYAKNVYESIRDMVDDLESRVEQEKKAGYEAQQVWKPDIYNIPKLNPDGAPISAKNRKLLVDALNTIEDLKALYQGRVVVERESDGKMVEHYEKPIMAEEDVKPFVRILQENFTSYEQQCGNSQRDQAVMEENLNAIEQQIAIVEKDMPEWKLGRDTQNSVDNRLNSFKNEDVYNKESDKISNLNATQEKDSENQDEKTPDVKEKNDKSADVVEKEDAKEKRKKDKKRNKKSKIPTSTSTKVTLRFFTALMIVMSVMFAVMGAWPALVVASAVVATSFGMDVTYSKKEKEAKIRAQNEVVEQAKKATEDILNQEEQKINELGQKLDKELEAREKQREEGQSAKQMGWDNYNQAEQEAVSQAYNFFEEMAKPEPVSVPEEPDYSDIINAIFGDGKDQKGQDNVRSDWDNYNQEEAEAVSQAYDFFDEIAKPEPAIVTEEPVAVAEESGYFDTNNTSFEENVANQNENLVEVPMEAPSEEMVQEDDVPSVVTEELQTPSTPPEEEQGPEIPMISASTVTEEEQLNLKPSIVNDGRIAEA